MKIVTHKIKYKDTNEIIGRHSLLCSNKDAKVIEKVLKKNGSTTVEVLSAEEPNSWFYKIELADKIDNEYNQR